MVTGRMTTPGATSVDLIQTRLRSAIFETSWVTTLWILTPGLKSKGVWLKTHNCMCDQSPSMGSISNQVLLMWSSLGRFKSSWDFSWTQPNSQTWKNGPVQKLNCLNCDIWAVPSCMSIIFGCGTKSLEWTRHKKNQYRVRVDVVQTCLGRDIYSRSSL